MKGALTAGGLGLIGLERWWFLLSKPKLRKATAQDGVQEITVNGAYKLRPNCCASSLKIYFFAISTTEFMGSLLSGTATHQTYCGEVLSAQPGVSCETDWLTDLLSFAHFKTIQDFAMLTHSKRF